MNNTKYCIGDIWKGIDKKKQMELLTLYDQNNEECTGCGLESACICKRCKFLNEAISGNRVIPVPIICGFMNTLHRFFKDVNTNSKTSVYKGYKQDKIEMRGDRAEMSDFPLYLNTVAGGLDRRDQAIGGFSFVVKIYAVPVVEIIG